MTRKRWVPGILFALTLIPLLLSACGSAEETGRVIGQTVRDFWNGLMEGCFGFTLLPFILGVVGLAAHARKKNN